MFGFKAKGPFVSWSIGSFTIGLGNGTSKIEHEGALIEQGKTTCRCFFIWRRCAVAGSSYKFEFWPWRWVLWCLLDFDHDKCVILERISAFDTNQKEVIGFSIVLGGSSSLWRDSEFQKCTKRWVSINTWPWIAALSSQWNGMTSPW